jgi:Tfp pilus assembly protein PilF
MYKTMASNGSAPPQFVFDPQYVHVVLPGQPMYFARRLYQLATAQLSEHEPQKAVAHLQKALAMAPKIPELHVAIGIAYRSQGLLGEAKNELEHALKLDPGLAAAYIELAQLQTELGQIEAAKMTLSMGVRLARERSEILRHAARLELQQGAHEKAFGLLESAKTLAPRDWTLLAEYGSMAMRLGRYELAHEALKTACEAGGPGVSVSQLQALLDAQVHTDTLPEEVEHTFSRILALQPRQQAAYQAFFNYLSRKGLADRALQISEEARQQGFSVSIEAAHRKEQVFLGGLPMGTNSEELRGWLKNRVVQPETLEMKNDKGGYPFAVLHVNAEEVARTIEQLDGAMWKGRRLRSSLFRSGTDRPRRKPHRNETK